MVAYPELWNEKCDAHTVDVIQSMQKVVPSMTRHEFLKRFVTDSCSLPCNKQACCQF